MAHYNGYSSWNAWNVSLWINNTEHMYKEARDLVKHHGEAKAVKRLLHRYIGEKTPDGAIFNATGIRQAIRGICD